MNHPAHDKLIAIAKGWQMEWLRKHRSNNWEKCTADQALSFALEQDWSLVRIAPGQPEVAEPIDMVLHCPKCGMQHVDDIESTLVWMGGSAPEPSHDEVTWDNPPHRTHLCHGCGHKWRPADVPTNGVAAVKTKGKADSPIIAPGQPGYVTPEGEAHAKEAWQARFGGERG